MRSGSPESATDALERVSETTRASGTNWALGVEARSRALLSEGDSADRLYREAIERLGRTRVRMELARAHLLYGEWLRRENRRVDARAQLDIAHEMFSRFGAQSFAERARGELQATGARVRTHTVATPTALTSQEAQIARLAGKGLTNPEIGAQLFISLRHGRMAPPQGVLEARHLLPPGDPCHPVRRRGHIGLIRAAGTADANVVTLSQKLRLPGHHFRTNDSAGGTGGPRACTGPQELTWRQQCSSTGQRPR